MEKQVKYRDRYEVTPDDLNNAQVWADEAQQHFVTDAITPERHFTGLNVTLNSATAVDIAEGRLWDGATGKVYAQSASQTVSVYSYLPTQDEKWLAITVYGQEEDADQQPRDFIIDLETGQTQPEVVAMRMQRVVVSSVTQGQESAQPQKPATPTGYTLIAHVRLSVSGIQEIVPATANTLPNLQKLAVDVASNVGWIASAGSRFDHLQSDIAGLGDALSQRATIEQAIQLAMDMARVKERMEIPDDYVNYGADHFLTEDESDTTDPAYSARLVEGIRPPLADSETVSLSLANPLDPAVKVFDSGHFLPAYNEIARLKMEVQQGDLTINGYEYQDTQMVLKDMSRTRIQYGETRTYCTNSQFWKNGEYDATTGIFRTNDGETWEVDPADRPLVARKHQHLRLTEFWESTYTEPYWDAVTTTHTVQGSIVAQTILMSQTGWLSSFELYFTKVDAAGGLTAILCDASRGEPDLSQSVARLSLASSALSEGWCKITWDKPVFVESGKRYALVLVAGAQHRIGYTAGTDYTNGVLLYAQAGAYFTEAADRDFMLRLNFAKFTSPRAIVQMQSLQLAGGIADIDWLYETVVPDGCSVDWQYQLGGLWYSAKSGSASNLASLPTLLPIRAVCIGTTDLMPMIRMTDSQVIVSRQDTSFVHVSTTRTLGGSSSDVRVRLLLEAFDPAENTVSCALIISGSPVAASSTKDEIVDSRSRWREFVFSLGTPVTEYVIKITGSTTSTAFHVAERYDLAL